MSAEPARASDDELASERARLVRFCAGYLRRADLAEDAAAETIARFLALAERPANARAWLLRAARNHCLNLRRDAAARGADVPLESDVALVASVTGAVTRLAREEQRARLARVLAELSEDERELVRLRYADELTREEIAALLGLTPALVKARLYEAVDKLRRRAAAAGLTQGER